MSREDDDVQAIIALVLELQDLAATERLAAAFTPASDGGRSGPGPSDPTGARAGVEGKWTDADRYAEKLRKIRDDLEQWIVRRRPRGASGQCVTRRCTGPATHDGYCWNCWWWRRNNPGFDPADQTYPEKDPDTGKPTGRTRSLVDDWNDRRKRDCACAGRMSHPTTGELMAIPGCDHSGEEGDRCWNKIGPADRHLECSTCRGRIERVRLAEQEAS